MKNNSLSIVLLAIVSVGCENIISQNGVEKNQVEISKSDIKNDVSTSLTAYSPKITVQQSIGSGAEEVTETGIEASGDTGQSFVSDGAPCHMSQASMVAYDISNKLLVYCNGKSWTGIKNGVKKRVADYSQRQLPIKNDGSLEAGKNQPTRETTSNSKQIATLKQKPKSFRCRALHSSKNLRCRSNLSSDKKSLAH